MLDFVLKQIDRCYVYIDDVVISAHSHEQSLVTLEKVFKRFRQHNLKIKPSKCHIGTGSISYLGYEITAGKGIQPGLAKTKTVRSFPEPCTVKEIRAFIELTSFFRRAIKDYSLISGPLNKLVRKDNGYTSGKLPIDARKSFLNLKHGLINRPCLAPVNFNAPFIVTTDASETHYASCLSQKGSDGIERPCGYSSKLLSTKESKQQPGMRERAALLHALSHWQPSCPVIFDEQVIRGRQTSDPDLQFHFMLHKQIIKSLPEKCQVKISTHIYNDLICTFLKNGRRALVAPKKLQAILIFLAHNNSGHLSGKYTYDRLAHNWFWPNMQSDIENYCRSCHDCARIKPPANYIRLTLEKMSPAAREFGDRLHIDLLSMPTSVEGHVAILTAVDAATGFVFAKACKDKTSKTVTTLLLDTINPYFSCPKTIVTDLGVEKKSRGGPIIRLF